MKEAALAICSHPADTFAEWIGRSTHFDAVPLLLEEGHRCMTAAQERHRQRIWTQEQPILPIHASGSASSGSSQLVGGVPIPEAQEEVAEQETPRVNVGRLHRHPAKARPTPGGGGGGSPPSSPEHPGGVDSDDYSTAIKSGGGCRCKRCQQVERRLAPARLNLSIFHSTDANADVTYDIWHFDVQGWLDQYKEASMYPHIFGSLQGYPGKWACNHCQGAWTYHWMSCWGAWTIPLGMCVTMTVWSGHCMKSARRNMRLWKNTCSECNEVVVVVKHACTLIKCQTKGKAWGEIISNMG